MPQLVPPPEPFPTSRAATPAAPEHSAPAVPTERFAARTAGMTASEIRALFAVASRPEVVSLAGGMPNLAALPLDALAAEVADLVGRDGQTALQYGSAQGVPALREQICEVMALEGIRADPDDVVVTVGSQMALDLVTRIFCDPGDVVLAEGPSYVGALGSFAAYQAQVVHVAMDEHGLVPELLVDALRALAAAGTTPKFLYTIPNFHNPAGVTLAVERRAEVLEICARYGVGVVEDNPYGLLGFTGRVYPALRSMDRDVVYLGSFSKTFASGLRVGWALAPPPSATGSCWPPSPPPSVRRASPRCWCRGTSPGTTGAARSRPSRRRTGSGAMRCSPRWRRTCRQVSRGTSRTAASTSG